MEADFFCEPATIAQKVERILGKDEVTGSIPVSGSNFRSQKSEVRFKKEIAKDCSHLSIRRQTSDIR